MNIHLILQMAADAIGERTALVSGDTRLTYTNLAQAARIVAAKLKPGERLAYLNESHPAFPAALFGAAFKGTPFVPINYRLAESLVDKLIARVAPALLITEGKFSIEGIRTISPNNVLQGEALDGESFNENGAVAIELFTSGTTGEPKSAVLRHANLMSYILGTVQFMSAGEDEANLISVPPYHIAGISAVLSSTYAGRRMVQLANFSPEYWVELAKQQKITSAFLVPTMLKRLFDYETGHSGAFDIPSLRAIAYGGGKMPLSVIETAMTRLPQVGFTNAYGLTETSSTICILGPEDHREAFESGNPDIHRRLTSVGRTLPGIRLKVCQEDGSSCGSDEAGLVYVRGDQISGEYKGLGSQLDDDGWFLTKDIGFLDDEGFLFIDGRADDVIVRGGENISPGEIEDVLRGHDAISDVAAVAVPDEEWGETVGIACVCNRDISDAEICNLVKANLRSSRLPSVIKRFGELPYSETGKLLRRVLRDRFAN